MKTTIDIPDETLDQLLKITKAKTKKDAILEAVEYFNKNKKIIELANALGSFKDFMSSEELEEMRKGS